MILDPSKELIGRNELGKAHDEVRSRLIDGTITPPGDSASQLERARSCSMIVRPFAEMIGVPHILQFRTGVWVVQIFAFNFKSSKIVEISIMDWAATDCL
jgi:hypothetical protein